MDIAEVKQKRHLLCVLGMHRSGTSAVTHFVHRLGAAVGGNLLEPMADINTEGFWEDSHIVALNERLLAADNLRWYDCEDIGAASANAEEKESIRAEAVAYLSETYACNDLAVLKDPRACRLLPFWLDVYRECGAEPLFLHVLRHPVEVAKSLHRRDRIPYEYAILLWLMHTLEALQHAPESSSLVVSYDSVLTDPTGLAAMLARRGMVDAEVLLERLAAAAEALKPTLKRQDRDLDGDLGLPRLVALAIEAHARLLMFEGRAVPRDDVDNLMRRYRQLRETSASDIAMLRRLAGELMAFSAETVRIGELHSRALATITERDHQLVVREAELQTVLKEGFLGEKVKELDALTGALVERDRVAAEKDRLLEEQVQIITKMDCEMAEKNHQLSAFQTRLGEIEGSLLWRLISRFTGK